MPIMDKKLITTYWKVKTRIWQGRTVFIIGGGPSLRIQAGLTLKNENMREVHSVISDFLTPIHNQRVIGVNNAYMLGDWIDACWFGDAGWYDRHKENLSNFAGLRAHCCSRHANRSGTFRLRRGIPYGIDVRPDAVSWNNNSGASAINLAVHFGAKKIILLGFDMKFAQQKKSNWHDDHNKKKRPKMWNPFGRFLKAFSYIKKDAEELGVEILNATPDSAIIEFPIIKLEDVFNELESAKVMA